MELEQLERLAAIATPGPWRYDYEPGYCGELIAANGTSLCTFNDEPDSADAAYIAAASPDVILRLVSIARAAKRHMEAADACDAGRRACIVGNPS